MNLKDYLLLLTTAFLLTACASTPPRLNNTAVKTTFDVIVNDQKEEKRWVEEDEKFLERDIRLASAATLTEDLVITIGKKEMTIKSGTYMFGARVPAKKLDVNIIEIVKALKTKSPDLFAKITNPSGETKKERDDARNAAFSEALKQYQIDRGEGNPFKVFCSSSKSSLNFDEFASALLTLGLTLGRKKDDVFCLQDSDGDGKFDKHWQSNLTYNFPPTIDSVYNDTEIQPISFNEIPRAEIGALGQLWLEIDINRKGTKATVNGKIGKGKRAIEFDNLRTRVSLDTLNTEHKFFDAAYEIIELDGSGRALVAITPAKRNQSVSLSKTVTYGTRTTYIPIFVPR